MEIFDEGDRVRNTDSVGGILGSSVPRDTEGRVVQTRNGLFDTYATVQFENGYTEEIKTSSLKRESGWF